MLKTIIFNFDEEDVDYTFEIMREEYDEMLLDRFADYYGQENNSGLRRLAEDFVGWDKLEEMFADVVEEDLKSDAYYKFTRETIDRILYYLPYNGPFNGKTYKKVLGFEVPFEGDIWVTLEYKLEKLGIEFIVDDETETLTIKK